MITSQYCVVMADYNAWMNAKMYSLCERLTDVDRKKDLGAFFRSIHGTLNHILACDLMFLTSFTKGAAFVECDGDLHEHFTELRQDRAMADSQLLAWSKAVSPEWLATSSTYTHFEDGVPRTVTQAFWVVHMFNHQTHHRGQITTLLTQLGHDIGSTDLHMSVPLPHADA
ncbi:MAG TPA: DinB family protein [Chitinolyticbacter sp.]|nr:DinB family protein [Chitinolyticbacter sp.]